MTNRLTISLRSHFVYWQASEGSRLFRKRNALLRDQLTAQYLSGTSYHKEAELIQQ